MERWDHHCPWLNNCVGVVNHVYFLSFLTCLTVQICSIFVFAVLTYIRYFKECNFDGSRCHDNEDFKKNTILSLLPLPLLLHPGFMHTVGILFMLVIFVALWTIGYQLWFLHLLIFLTNKTTKERSTKKRVARTESASDNFSTTTSLLAEKIVENIGKRREATGWARLCKNFASFYASSIQADCCIRDDKIGYQDRIVKELYLNAKERHGYEDDWGMVVQRLNSELETNETAGNDNSEKPRGPFKARANTLKGMFEGKKPVSKIKSVN